MTRFSSFPDTIGNIELVKQLNSAIIYRIIALQGPISRIKIAEKSQLAPASITKITRQFLQAGLIKEIPSQNSTGGRPAISIIAENTRFQAVAIQLSRKNLTIELYNLLGDCLAHHQQPIEGDSQQALETFIIQNIERFIRLHQDKIDRLIAISLVSPGLIDAHHGEIHYIPYRQIHKWQLGQALIDHFKIPCFIGHDIRALALAEHFFGATRDCSDSILIRVHRGIGTGIIIQNQVFLGQNQYAGEIGHIQIDPLGEQCHCGHFGCLESIVSNDGLRQKAQKHLAQGHISKLTASQCEIKAICAAANQHDAFAVELIQAAAHQLGKVIAMMLNILNPQKVVIAGDITQAQSILFPAIDAAIKHQTLGAIYQSTELVASELAHRSAIGAFALVKRAMYHGELLRYIIDGTYHAT